MTNPTLGYRQDVDTGKGFNYRWQAPFKQRGCRMLPQPSKKEVNMGTLFSFQRTLMTGIVGLALLILLGGAISPVKTAVISTPVIVIRMGIFWPTHPKIRVNGSIRKRWSFPIPRSRTLLFTRTFSASSWTISARRPADR